MFTITISAQGLPDNIIRRGYAAFATDQGPTEMTGGSWAVDASGTVNQDALDDLYARASPVLATMENWVERGEAPNA